jgi:hypothetical protein
VLTDQKTLPGSGIVALSYSVAGTTGPPPRIAYVRTGTAKPKTKGPATGKSARSARPKSPRKKADKRLQKR